MRESVPCGQSLVNATARNVNVPGGRELPKAPLAQGAKGEKVFLKRDIR